MESRKVMASVLRSGGKRGKEEETDDEKNHQGKKKNFIILTYKRKIRRDRKWPFCVLQLWYL